MQFKSMSVTGVCICLCDYDIWTRSQEGMIVLAKSVCLNCVDFKLSFVIHQFKSIW